MEKTEANILLAIDQSVGKHAFSPAEYEIVRRVIYETADFDYLFEFHFSDRALSAGAAALAARTAIVVDVPLIQTGIATATEKTFANPIYAHLEGHNSYGLSTLAERYPEAIFIIGKEQTALWSFLSLIEQDKIQPAFTIVTAPKLIEFETTEKRLQALKMPHIRLTGRKGNATAAVGIVNGLIDLAWQVYTQKDAIAYR